MNLILEHDESKVKEAEVLVVKLLFLASSNAMGRYILKCPRLQEKDAQGRN
jgi:hypothetical protein